MQALCRARRRAANLSGNYLAPKWEVLLGTLFWCAFAAAVLLHAAVHWHITDEAAKDTGHRIQAYLAGATLVFVVVSLLLWVWHVYTRREQFRFDVRALAEGLRVQAYWAAAGLSRSVSANYMQRQREGLGWIRRAVSALAAPYSEWRRRWAAAGPGPDAARLDVQIGLLTMVRYRWVREQLEYAAKKAAGLNTAREFWHPFGSLLAAAGVLQVLVWWFWVTAHAPPIDPGVLVYPVSVLGLVFGVLMVYGWWTSRLGKTEDSYAVHRPHSRPHPIHWGKKSGTVSLRAYQWWAGFQWAFRDAFHWVSFEWLYRFRRFGRLPRWVRLSRVAIGYAVAAALLSLPWYVLCHFLGECRPWVPNAETLWQIAFGVHLIAGAMAVAWVEKRLMTEELHQYTAMARTYRAADRRLAEHLLAARDAVAANNIPAAEARVKAAQELLFAVGLQALDENGEWLLLHRARPIEPVMAG